MTTHPFVIVGHHAIAGKFAIRLLQEGRPVLWLKHRPLPPVEHWMGVRFSSMAPLLRPRSTTSKLVSRPVQLIWERHRVTLEKERLAFELKREFPDLSENHWKHPHTVRGAHFGKQAWTALSRYLSLHYQPELTRSPLDFMVQQTGGPAELLQDEIATLESEVERLGGECDSSSLKDLIVERGRLWGVVLDSVRGAVPASQVLLCDHLASFDHVDAPALHALRRERTWIQARRLTFSLVFKYKDLPEGFSGEAIVLDTPDTALEGPHALYLQSFEDPLKDQCVLVVRQDLPLLHGPLTAEDSELCVRKALQSLERKLFPYLKDCLVSLRPPLAEVGQNLPPLSQEHFFNLSFTARKDLPVRIVPGCDWYGPEAWGRWGAFSVPEPITTVLPTPDREARP